MHSCGVKERIINHPILQDDYEVIIKLKQLRWRCTNPDCKYEENESFKFISKQKRTTNATDMMIINAFRNLNESATSKKFSRTCPLLFFTKRLHNTRDRYH